MVKDVGLTQYHANKDYYIKKNPLKARGTRISCQTDTGQGGQRAGWTYIGLDEHRAIHTLGYIDRCRTIKISVALSAHCANFSYSGWCLG